MSPVEDSDPAEELIWEFLANNTDEIIKLDPSLDDLVGDGYARREEITTLVCDGRPTYTILKCPKCGGSNLEPMGAWIHAKCGSVSYKESMCPKCGAVNPSEMIYIGPVYRCRDCGAIVNYPLVSTLCNEIKLRKAFIYRITEKGKSIIKRVERLLEKLPDPKAKFIRIGNLKVEALIIEPNGVKAIILSSREDTRGKALEEMGISVELIQI